MQDKNGCLKPSVAARFSRAALHYDNLACLQRHVAALLMKLLKTGPVPGRILEIGCGTGVLTEMLARLFPGSEIDALDISESMLARGREKLAGNSLINWIAADAGRISTLTKYPLIVSSCAMHWITPIDSIIGRLGSLLDKDGRMAFALMVQGTFAELSDSRARIAPHKPSGVKLPSGDDVRRAIKLAGLKICAESLETIRHEYHSADELLMRLHDQGLTGRNHPSEKSLLTRGELCRLKADYAGNYSSAKGVYASYRNYCCLVEKHDGDNSRQIS